MEGLWRSQIIAGLNRDMNTLGAQMRYKPPGYISCYIYLKTLDISHYIDILTKEIYKLGEASETYSPSISSLHKGLGQKVQDRLNIYFITIFNIILKFWFSFIGIEWKLRKEMVS